MYKCINEGCDFESEIKVTDNRQWLFIKGECRSCYYNNWVKNEPDLPFNTTSSENHHYNDVGYDPARVQDILQRPWH